MKVLDWLLWAIAVWIVLCGMALALARYPSWALLADMTVLLAGLILWAVLTHRAMRRRAIRRY